MVLYTQNSFDEWEQFSKKDFPTFRSIESVNLFFWNDSFNNYFLFAQDIDLFQDLFTMTFLFFMENLLLLSVSTFSLKL